MWGALWHPKTPTPRQLERTDAMRQCVQGVDTRFGTAGTMSESVREGEVHVEEEHTVT
jgi:hypothetical protein